MLKKIDKLLNKVTFFLSWISVACILLMAILAVVDIIMAKFFGGGIQIQKEVIEQGMIPVYILFVAYVQLNGGLMQVDIFSRKYRQVGKKVLSTVTSVLGTIIMGYAGARVFVLFQDYLRKQTRATTMMTSIKIWPFALCLSIGLFLLAFAYLWTLVRVYFISEKESADTSKFEEEGSEK